MRLARGVWSLACGLAYMVYIIPAFWVWVIWRDLQDDESCIIDMLKPIACLLLLLGMVAIVVAWHWANLK